MIQPVNGHLVIEPVKHEGFIATSNDSYQEIGVVVALSKDINWIEKGVEVNPVVSIGDKVYFDSWLAKKYPKETGQDGEFYWLVKWEDVAAVITT